MAVWCKCVALRPSNKKTVAFITSYFCAAGARSFCTATKNSRVAIRQRVAATLTHEVLGRLVEDFNKTAEDILAS